MESQSSPAAERRLREIILTAAELFDRAGYTTTSMEDIAEAVGLAKPTLYHYVKSKDEILYQIHREFMAVAFTAMESHEGRLSPEEEARATIVEILDLIAKHRPLVRVFFEHFRDLPARHQRIVVEQRDRYAAGLTGVIRRGFSRGDFRSVDPKLTALAIFGMCNWAYQWYDPSGRSSAQQLGEMFGDLVMTGIHGTGKPRQHPVPPPPRLVRRRGVGPLSNVTRAPGLSSTASRRRAR